MVKQYGQLYHDTRRALLETEAVQKLMKVLRDPAFRKEIAHFSGNDYRDLGKIITEV